MAADKCDTRIIHAERVAKAHKTAIQGEEAETLSQFFKVFSDPGRLRILSALRHQEMCVCDLAAFLQGSESAVSHQLRLLRTMNLVKNRREGTVLYYRLTDKHVDEIIVTGLTHIKE
ncbi:ArsR/SmtB family transcription factor [Desulfotalea psychrophila]|uniref:Related to cadmium efflux system accessory protein n=1 Tax=Desulfotalea psychrophila (strain LSv54 / DSM 12343) TaxID=177439 RepID=Q6AS13_DESPS|nr:metalloregulator ArsR/SmtB family transcription factor [Desulfotalea psychrophila]CAG34862.1 related to cadmium efflux system accessory protein [Desulfotalea psychrophila LSv54]